MDTEPSLPILISVVDGKYLLFDIDAITWLRKHHQICGVFIGTLPQDPSQNVFLGLPMQIMPEEAQLLTSLGIAYLLDDARAHDEALAKANRPKQREYIASLQQQAQELSELKAQEKEAEKARIMKQVEQKKKKKPLREKPVVVTGSSSNVATTGLNPIPSEETSEATSISPALFETSDDVAESRTHSRTVPTPQMPRIDMAITPTTSALLLNHSLPSATSTSTPAPSAAGSFFNSNPSSFFIYQHLHTRHSHQDTSAPISIRYFATPGLRFGCQFCVYPGDPLRFHSHFLSVGVGWDEEIDLMDIVSGGRLGTAVKKGWLFGGMEPGGDLTGKPEGKMKTFSVEWAGM